MVFIMAVPNTIFESAYKGDFESVKLQVDESIDVVKKKDDNGRNLLHWASISGNVKLVTFLLETGSDVDASEETEATPLVLAASAGRLEVVTLLIEHGADVNHKTDQGHSALQYAASKGWLEICMKLVENKANVNISDIRGATPLHRAASKGNVNIVKFLLAHDDIDVNAKDVYGNTPLHLACEEDRQEEATLLLQKGAKTDTMNKEKKTPLDLCSRGLCKLLTVAN